MTEVSELDCPKKELELDDSTALRVLQRDPAQRFRLISITVGRVACSRVLRAQVA